MVTSTTSVYSAIYSEEVEGSSRSSSSHACTCPHKHTNARTHTHTHTHTPTVKTTGGLNRVGARNFLFLILPICFKVTTNTGNNYTVDLYCLIAKSPSVTNFWLPPPPCHTGIHSNDVMSLNSTLGYGL